jgi:hypothetical protein
VEAPVRGEVEGPVGGLEGALVVGGGAQRLECGGVGSGDGDAGVVGRHEGRSGDLEAAPGGAEGAGRIDGACVTEGDELIRVE